LPESAFRWHFMSHDRVPGMANLIGRCGLLRNGPGAAGMEVFFQGSGHSETSAPARVSNLGHVCGRRSSGET
jgi:hypothetical protein